MCYLLFYLFYYVYIYVFYLCYLFIYYLFIYIFLNLKLGEKDCVGEQCKSSERSPYILCIMFSRKHESWCRITYCTSRFKNTKGKKNNLKKFSKCVQNTKKHHLTFVSADSTLLINESRSFPRSEVSFPPPDQKSVAADPLLEGGLRLCPFNNI